MTDEITPARLRELAKRHEQNAAELREYEETCRDAGSWRDDQEQMITPESEEETAAALRAAASAIEIERETNGATALLLQQARDTLAAREALLKRAGEEMNHASFALCFAISNIAKGTDSVLVEALVEAEKRPRALAAEIAAALNQGENQ